MERLLRRAFNWQSFPESFREGVIGASYQYQVFSTKGRTKSKSDKSNSGDENTSKKDLALQESIDQITKTFGKGSIMWVGGSETPRHVPVVSTGSINLDIALGIGGFPKGRVIEIFGPEASGKTTLALHVIAEAQKDGGYCAFLDADHALDPALAESIGVNTQNLLLSRPDCGEQALSLVDSLIRSGSVDVVVVDSVAALVPKGELDGDALRKLSHLLSQSQCILLFLNQVRPKKWPFPKLGGPTEVTYGGNALKLYSSVRLNIRRTGFVKKGEETVGSQVLVKVIKNKHAPPFRTAEFNLKFGKGICRDAEIISLGVEHKLLTKKGSFYKINGETLQGRDALRQYLTDNPTVKDELFLKLQEILMSSTGAPEVELSEMEEEMVSADTSEEKVVSAAEG